MVDGSNKYQTDVVKYPPATSTKIVNTLVRSWFTILSCTPVPSLVEPLD